MTSFSKQQPVLSYKTSGGRGSPSPVSPSPLPWSLTSPTRQHSDPHPPNVSWRTPHLVLASGQLDPRQGQGHYGKGQVMSITSRNATGSCEGQPLAHTAQPPHKQPLSILVILQAHVQRPCNYLLKVTPEWCG